MSNDSRQTSKSTDLPLPQRLVHVLWMLFIARLWLSSLFLVIFGLALRLGAPLFGDPRVQTLLSDLGNGMVVAGVTTIFLDILVIRRRQRFEEQLKELTQHDIKENIDEILNVLRTQGTAESTSDEVLREANISRIYSSRKDASQEITRSVYQDDITRIRLLGISLNDFVQPGGQNNATSLHRAWLEIRNFVHYGRQMVPGQERDLEIQALIVDPHCFGARLRSLGEQGTPIGRMQTDVDATYQEMLDLQRVAKDKYPSTRVKFEFGLYRLPPQLFQFTTDDVTFIQPYYFWSKRDLRVPMLVMQLDSKSPLRSEMENHFDLIWNYARISPEEIEGHHVGIDAGAYETGMRGIYTDPDKARDRILYLMRKAKTRIWIQGISLRSYFEPGKVLCAALAEKMSKGLEVKVLLLDPTREQAHYRSYREHGLGPPGSKISFRDYVSSGMHDASRLCQDTRGSIAVAKDMMRTIEGHQFQARLYTSAPVSFMAIIDDVLLLEQYHYGKPRAAEEDPFAHLLGKDMALVEYAGNPSDLERSRQLFGFDEDGSPFQLLSSHFRYVFEELAKPLDSSEPFAKRQFA